MSSPTYPKTEDLPDTGIIVTYIFRKRRKIPFGKRMVEPYSGPPLREGAYFENTMAASRYLGLKTNGVGKAFRKMKDEGRVIVRGVAFTTTERSLTIKSLLKSLFPPRIANNSL